MKISNKLDNDLTTQVLDNRSLCLTSSGIKQGAETPYNAVQLLHFTGTKLSRKQTRAPLCLSPHYSPEPRSGSHLKVH